MLLCIYFLEIRHSERVLTICMLTKHSILGLSDLISQEDSFYLFAINEVSRITVNHKPSTFQDIPSISQTQRQSDLLLDKSSRDTFVDNISEYSNQILYHQWR